MCRALLEGDGAEDESILDQIASELIDRKLLDPNETLGPEDDLIRRFASAFIRPER